MTRGGPALLLQQLAQQSLGCLGIATALNQNIKHEPVLVDGSPEPMLPACNADHDLIKVPLVAWAGRRRRILLAKL